MKKNLFLILLFIAGLTAAFDFNATNVYLKSGETSSFVNFTYNSQNYYMMKINGQESMIFQSNNTPVTDQNTINQLLSAYFSSQFSQLPFNNLESQINASFYNVSFYYGGCLQGIESYLAVPYNTYMLSVIIPNQGFVCQLQWEAYNDMQNITSAQNQSIYNLNQSIQQFYSNVQQQNINGILGILSTIQTSAQQLDTSYNRMTSDFTTFTNFCGGNNTNTAIIGMFLTPTQQNENISCFYQSFIDQDLKNIAGLAQQGNNYNIQSMESQIYTQTTQRTNAAQIEMQKSQSLNEMQSAEATYQKVKNFYAGTSVSTSFLSGLQLQAQNSLNSSNFSSGIIDKFSQAVQQFYGVSSQFNLTTYSLSNTLNVINTAIERVGRSDPRIQQVQQNYTSIEEQYKNLSQELSNGIPITTSQLQAVQTQSDSLSNYATSLQPPENQFGWIQIIAVIVIVIVIIIVLFYFKKFKKEPPKITDLSTEYNLNSNKVQKPTK
ncbi:MAG: hypothetical protein M1594_00515 [Candidatus Marsarchaeota archaeon]|nr:hypothetical protein [Candidatus Marsarchaeota archaeon]